MECAFTYPMRTEYGMFVMYCLQCLCQLFCSTEMCCLFVLYNCLVLLMVEGMSVVRCVCDWLGVA